MIIVDECHRGSADLDSNWHEILAYFGSASMVNVFAEQNCLCIPAVIFFHVISDSFCNG